MTRKFFGTDGIRGASNSAPITADTVLRVAQAAGERVADDRLPLVSAVDKSPALDSVGKLDLGVPSVGGQLG